MNIDKNFCFSSNVNSIKTHHEALAYYNSHKKELIDWISNDDDTPIFIDTNVILNIYMIPSGERQQFINFLQKNKRRIHISSQVEKEYMNHRLLFVDVYRFKMKKIKNEFQEKLAKLNPDFSPTLKELDSMIQQQETKGLVSESENLLAKLKDFILTNKIFLDKSEDYKNLIEELNKTFEKECTQIENEIDIRFKDPLLEQISQLDILQPLQDVEITFLKSLYDKELEKYKIIPTDEKDYYAFPGCGEKKQKKDKKIDPRGDFYIYHEMVKFMKDNNKDILFLTHDVTKSDWIRKDKMPFEHYIACTYKLTGHAMFIINAQDFLPLSYKNTNTTEEIEDSIEESNEQDSELVIQNDKSLQSDSATPLTYSSYRKFKAIDEENFLNELKTYSKWAEEYGENYVSENFFIYTVLGNKGYQFYDTKEMIKKLSSQHKIEIYQRDMGDGGSISCIRIQQQH